ncbi:Leucine rich repeat protein [Opitutaceae bacterium TAV1]|nr:Leucine rich repeat protein [Opitutaceae bacterium TAV1]
MSADTLTAEDILARIRRDGVRRAALALRKPPVPSRLLQELATLPSDDTDTAALALQFVAAYPLAPSHLLEEIANTALDSDPEAPPSPLLDKHSPLRIPHSAISAVLAHLATNPRTPPHLLTRFAAHADPLVRAQAAAHPQLPSRELFALAADPDAGVRRTLAANPSLRLPHQAALLADTDPSVRVHLTATAAPQAQLALALGADDSAVVRTHAVATLKVEEDLLLGWAACDEEDVQLALLQRRELPAEVSRVLLHSPHPSVRRATVAAISANEADGAHAATQLDDIDLLFLATRGTPEERAWVASAPVLARPLQSLLAQDADSAVRAALAANPALDEAVARYFTTRNDEPVNAALARNPAVPADLVEELAATRSPAVLAALAYRENLDPRLATFLLGHSPDFRRHRALLSVSAHNDNATDGTTGNATPPPLPELDLDTARILLADSLPTVRVLAVTACPAWRRADLYDIARDPAPAVRIAAIRHPNAADELLSDWQADPDPLVAAAAREAAETRARARTRPVLSVRATHGVPPRTSAPNPEPAGKAGLDAAAPRPNLTDSTPVAPSATGDSAISNPQSATPVTARPAAAPDLFSKLKRFFWQ